MILNTDHQTQNIGFSGHPFTIRKIRKCLEARHLEL
jgi:hypothetical protein